MDFTLHVHISQRYFTTDSCSFRQLDQLEWTCEQNLYNYIHKYCINTMENVKKQHILSYTTFAKKHITEHRKNVLIYNKNMKKFIFNAKLKFKQQEMEF